MIEIVGPSDEGIKRIQSKDDAFYWSACAEGLLRKHGIRPQQGGGHELRILLRGSTDSRDQGPQLIEGPLSDAVAASLRIGTRHATGGKLELLDADGDTIAEALYPAFQVRRIPETRDEVSEPYVYEHEDRRWTNRTLRLQFLEGGEGWQTIAWGQLDGSEPGPVAVTDGSRVVLGAPLFDIAAFTHMVPPLPVGWYTRVSGFDVLRLERWLISLLVDLCDRHGIPVARIPTWPDGRRAAFTVRHDYDRRVADEAITETLEYYVGRGVKATWFILVDSPPPADQIQAMLDGGHEVALHTIARTLDGFEDEVRRFTNLTGEHPAGYTAHGGLGSSGFLGLTQHIWAEATGMTYGELLGAFAGIPHLVHKVSCNVPTLGSLVIPNTHRSLDRGTRPDAHFLEHLLERLPIDLSAGRHVVAMNHPDIHWLELRTLLDRLDLDDVWPATMKDVCSWASGRLSAAP